LNSFKISVKEFVARTGAISLQAKAAESRDRFLNESRGQVFE
jgi:hypothetical protein